MKKLYFLLMALAPFTMAAQIPNPGFEELVENSLQVTQLKNWGALLITSVIIDIDTGEVVGGDQIIFDGGPGLSFPTVDSHSGQWAMELRNAFNAGTNEIITGRASLFNNEFSEEPTGYNNGFTLAEGSFIDYFGFYYHFVPLGDEVAVATMEVFNADGATIGLATIDLAATASYTYTGVPVNIPDGEVPAFITIDFVMANEASTPVIGSRLLIDDVKVNTINLAADEKFAKNNLVVYPTVTTDALTIAGTNGLAPNAGFEIHDMNGRMVSKAALNGINRVEVSNLAAGSYFIVVENSAMQQQARFIKM